jgi:hypothetical protein
MVEDIEQKIRIGAAKFGLSLFPGSFLNSESKQCCVIGALALYNLDELPYYDDIIGTEEVAIFHNISYDTTLALEAGFECWGESRNTRLFPEFYQLGIRLRGEVIRVEESQEEQ